MSNLKDLTKFVAESISSFEESLNQSIKDRIKDTLGISPSEVEFRGGLFEAGFGGYRSEVEIRLTFTLPICFKNWDDFAKWHDSDACDSDLEEWGFLPLIDNSDSHNINLSSDDKDVSITIKFSESSFSW